MVDFTRIVLVILGILSLIGGVYQAIETWPGANITSDQIADAAKSISMYWLASGIVSWAVFWSLEAIIYELTLIRRSLERGSAISGSQHSNVHTSPVPPPALFTESKSSSFEEPNELAKQEWEYKGETITKRGHDFYIGDEQQSYATLVGARARIDSRRK